MHTHGQLLDSSTVRFERLLPGPVDRVWAYLTDSDKRALWLAAGATELREGGRVEFRFRNSELSELPDIPPPEKYRDMPEEVAFSGTVTRVRAPHLLAYTWNFGDEDSEVTYELEERGDKVLLTLTHRRLDTRDLVLSVSGGWHTHLDILADVLAGREVQPFWKAHTANEAEYERRFALPGRR